MREALQAMGVGADAEGGIVGRAGKLRGGCTLDCGDGGTPARFLMAAAALAEGPVVIDGSPRLRERPMQDGGDLLQQLGVECRWLGARGCLPVEVNGGGRVLGGDVVVGRTASSQFVSALLLIAPWMERGLRVRFADEVTSASYVELTVSTLQQWGAAVAVKRDQRGAAREVAVGQRPLKARDVQIEADASSAVYWAAAAALVEGSSVELAAVPLESAQPDLAAIRALQAMGARVEAVDGGIRVRCSVERGGAPLRGMVVDASLFPDGALAVIAASAVAHGPSRFNGLGTLRVKESDRIEAMASNLRMLGCVCEAGADWLSVQPLQRPPSGVTLPTYNDHRIAMSFAVLGLRTGGITISDPQCVAKSYPSFWTHLATLQK
jgi:3-phosphoshikimate 1-carboxyvinyltransferase